MGAKPKFVHLNCHNAMALGNEQFHDAIVEGVDVVSLNEPYVSEGSGLGTPGGYAKVYSAGNRHRAAIWLLDKQLHVL